MKRLAALTLILWLAATPAWSAALIFGANTSDVVTVADVADIRLTAASTVTYMVWYKLTTFTASRRLIAKNGVDGNGGPQLVLNGTTELQAVFSKTVNAAATTTTLSLATNTIYCTAYVYNPADTQPRIYHGLAGVTRSNLVEPSYAGGATIGSGTSASTAALTIGNLSNASPTSAVQGEIYAVMVFNTALTITKAQEFEYNPHLPPDGSCMAFWIFGNQGTGTQIDYTGKLHTGTITGATLATDGLPVKFF